MMALSTRFGLIVPVSFDSTDEDSEDDEFFRTLRRKATVCQSPNTAKISFQSNGDCDSDASEEEIDPEWKQEFRLLLKQSKTDSVGNVVGKSAVHILDRDKLPLESLKAALDNYIASQPHASSVCVEMNDLDAAITESEKKIDNVSLETTESSGMDDLCIKQPMSPMTTDNDTINVNNSCVEMSDSPYLDKDNAVPAKNGIIEGDLPKRGLEMETTINNPSKDKADSNQCAKAEDATVVRTYLADSDSGCHPDVHSTQNFLAGHNSPRREFCAKDNANVDIDRTCTQKCVKNESKEYSKLSNVFKDASKSYGTHPEKLTNKSSSTKIDKRVIKDNGSTKTSRCVDSIANKGKGTSLQDAPNKGEQIPGSPCTSVQQTSKKQLNKKYEAEKSDKLDKKQLEKATSKSQGKFNSNKDLSSIGSKCSKDVRTNSISSRQKSSVKYPSKGKSEVMKINTISSFPLDELLPVAKEQTICKPAIVQPPDPPRKVVIAGEPERYRNLSQQMPYQNMPIQPYTSFQEANCRSQSLQEDNLFCKVGSHHIANVESVYPMREVLANPVDVQPQYHRASRQDLMMDIESRHESMDKWDAQSQFHGESVTKIPANIVQHYPINVESRYSTASEADGQDVSSVSEVKQYTEGKALAHDINHIMSLIENGNRSALSVIQNALNRDISMNLKALADKARHNSELTKVTKQLKDPACHLNYINEQRSMDSSQCLNTTLDESKQSNKLFHLFVQQCSDLVKTENDKDMLKSLVKLLKNESGNQLTGTGFTPPDFEESFANTPSLTAVCSPCSEQSISKADLFEGRTILKGGVQPRHIPKVVVKKHGKMSPKDPRLVKKARRCPKYLPLPKFAVELYKQGKLKQVPSFYLERNVINPSTKSSQKESSNCSQNQLQESKQKHDVEQSDSQKTDNHFNENVMNAQNASKKHSDMENVNYSFKKCDLGVKSNKPHIQTKVGTNLDNNVAQLQANNDKTMVVSKMTNKNFASPDTGICESIPVLLSDSGDERKKIVFKVSARGTKVDIGKKNLYGSASCVNDRDMNEQNSIPVLIRSHDQALKIQKQDSERSQVLHSINLDTNDPFIKTGLNQLKDTKPCIGIVKPMPFKPSNKEQEKAVVQDCNRTVVNMELDSDSEEKMDHDFNIESHISTRAASICIDEACASKRTSKELTKENTSVSKNTSKADYAVNYKVQMLHESVGKSGRDDNIDKSKLRRQREKSICRKRSLSCSSNESVVLKKQYCSDKRDTSKHHRSYSSRYDRSGRRDHSSDRKHEDRKSYKPYEHQHSSRNRKQYDNNRDYHHRTRGHHSPSRTMLDHNKANRSRKSPEVDVNSRLYGERYSVTSRVDQTDTAIAKSDASKNRNDPSEYDYDTNKTKYRKYSGSKDLYNAVASDNIHVKEKPLAFSDLSDEEISREYRARYHSSNSILPADHSVKLRREVSSAVVKPNVVTNRSEKPLYVVRQIKKKDTENVKKDKAFLENYKKVLKKTSEIKRDLNARRAPSRDNHASARNVLPYTDTFADINQELEEGEI